jgi:hypothetical protein
VRWYFWVFKWSCGDGSRRRGRWRTRQQPRRPRTRRLNSTNTPHTRLLRFLAGQRIHTAGRCDADRLEMPRLKRRPVRVGDATGRPWGPTTPRLQGGKVCHSNVCAHLGLVAGTCSTYQANIGKSWGFFYPLIAALYSCVACVWCTGRYACV